MTVSQARLLLVDDEAALRRVLRRALVGAGFDVVEAENGRAAQQLVQASHFDLVVTDVRMPVMGGLELLQWLIATHPRVPVVLMSGTFDVCAADAVAALRACHFLRKPFSMTDLQRCALQAATADGAVARRQPDRGSHSPRPTATTIPISRHT